VNEAVEMLEALRSDYADLTGQEVSTEKGERVVKKVTRLGLEAKKEDSLSDWYSQVDFNYITNF
jgi:hypothetical protein